MKLRVVLIDDDPDVRETLTDRLRIEGMEVFACRAFVEGIDHISPRFNGVVVTDIRMPGKSGLDLVARAHAIDPELPVLVLSGYADTETVVAAMRGGAVTVLEKPCPIERLIAEIRHSAERRALVLRTRARNARDAIAKAPGRPPREQALAPQMVEYERALIQRALKRNRGDKTKTAQELGISRSQLYAKIKLLEL